MECRIQQHWIQLEWCEAVKVNLDFLSLLWRLQVLPEVHVSIHLPMRTPEWHLKKLLLYNYSSINITIPLYI